VPGVIDGQREAGGSTPLLLLASINHKVVTNLENKYGYTMNHSQETVTIDCHFHHFIIFMMARKDTTKQVK